MRRARCSDVTARREGTGDSPSAFTVLIKRTFLSKSPTAVCKTSAERERERNAAVVIDITKSSIWAALRVFDVRAWWALSCAIDKTLLLSIRGGHKCWLSAIDKQRSSQGALALDDVLFLRVTERNQTYLQKEDTGTGAALKPWTARGTTQREYSAPLRLQREQAWWQAPNLSLFRSKGLWPGRPSQSRYRSPTCSTLPRGKTEPKQSPAPLHCMIPLMPLACEPPHKLHVNGLDHPDAFSYNASELLSIGLNYKNEQPDATPSAIGQYKLFRPRVVNQASFHAMGAAVCYLNCGESACAPHAGLVNLHPMASYLLNAPLHARQKSLFSSERANRTGVLLPARLLRSFLTLICTTTWRRARTSYRRSCSRTPRAKLNGGSPQTKPKVFTCEVCGKVRRARSIFCLAQIASCTFF